MFLYLTNECDSMPNNYTVTLNQSDLLSSATAEKTALITRLREYLDQTSREKLLERRALETDHRMKELNAVPYPIYIG